MSANSCRQTSGVGRNDMAKLGYPLFLTTGSYSENSVFPLKKEVLTIKEK